jgi:hypothetical protein
VRGDGVVPLRRLVMVPNYSSIRQLEYWVRTAHESHTNPYRIRIRYGVRGVLEESG